MRMLLPPVRRRREIDRLLGEFFRTHEPRTFQRAMVQMARYYDLPAPRVTWFEYLDWGKTAGRTYENGDLHLVHPESWKRGRKYNTERRWIHMIYHEMAHYIFWANAERKADVFASRMVRGLSRASDARSRQARKTAASAARDRVGETAVAARRAGRSAAAGRAARRRRPR